MFVQDDAPKNYTNPRLSSNQRPDWRGDNGLYFIEFRAFL